MKKKLFLDAAIREGKEEVDVSRNDLKLVHTIHCFTNDEEWTGQFFLAEKWKGQPKANEPEKYSEIKWVAINDLPENTIPYVAQSIDNFQNNISYSSYVG